MSRTVFATTSQPTPLRSQLLSSVPGVIHGVTHRIEGMGPADSNFSYAPPRDRGDAWAARQVWCEAIGFPAERLVLTGLVHGTDVLQVTAEHAGGGSSPERELAGIADALMTDQPNLAIGVTHADCQSLLIADPDHHAIAAVHAGWRGTVADIAGTTIRAMQEAYGSDPAELLVYLGPSIGGCCNEVGPEVTAAWREQVREFGPLAELAVTKPGPKEHFDVPRANTLLLQRAGVRPEHIEVSAACTKCDTETWFSHRGHGPGAGRQASLIMLTEEGIGPC
ncbi:MAG TPA: peptidoglycan editing factor PgeF [Thermomicrobiales bacterium]|nr:peptidoglycan editing factor PgeF [Thermomicrobiales bacterium]